MRTLAIDMDTDITDARWVIRRAVETDLDPLFELASRFAASFTPEREAFSRSLRAILADEDAWLSVVDRQGDLLAYCLGFDHVTFFANGRVSWVEEVMVSDPWRRGGLGRALMNAFEHWAMTRGSKLVSLATRRAAPFYQALGYEESAVYYRKRL